MNKYPNYDDMKKLFIILDPAHGEEVAGKRSPDGKHIEYLWSRQICKKLKDRLVSLGYVVALTNETNKEIGLSKRKEFANSIVAPSMVKLLLSLHNNAAGNMSEWMTARGVEIYTTKGDTQSDKFAETILSQLQEDFKEFKFRVDKSDGDRDKEENFTVLMGGNYKAILLEWLFQDNPEDVTLLGNSNVNNQLVDSLVRGLYKIEKSL